MMDRKALDSSSSESTTIGRDCKISMKRMDWVSERRFFRSATRSTLATSRGQIAGTWAQSVVKQLRTYSVYFVVSSAKHHAMAIEQSRTKFVRNASPHESCLGLTGPQGKDP